MPFVTNSSSCTCLSVCVCSARANLQLPTGRRRRRTSIFNASAATFENLPAEKRPVAPSTPELQTNGGRRWRARRRPRATDINIRGGNYVPACLPVYLSAHRPITNTHERYERAHVFNFLCLTVENGTNKIKLYKNEKRIKKGEVKKLWAIDKT